VDRDGKKEEDENSDQHFSNGGAHGFGMRPGFGTEIWRVPLRLHKGDAAYRHIKGRQRLTKAGSQALVMALSGSARGGERSPHDRLAGLGEVVERQCRPA
jgi:hypothetical protein